MDVNGQLHASAAFPPGDEPHLDTEEKTGWPQGQSVRFGED